MVQRVVLRVLMTWMAVVVIVVTTSDLHVSQNATLRLGQAIAFPTISTFNGPKDPEVFIQFIDFVKKSFPAMHETELVDVTVVNNYSLLYYVHGSNRHLQPYLLAAHYDVTPRTGEEWEIDPFRVHEIEDFLHGKGTLDGKSQLMAMLETVEAMVKSGSPLFPPQRGYYLAIGHDQLVNGYNGAQEIAKLLMRRKVWLEFVLDGGTPILNDPDIPANKPVAIIGVAEKGYATVLMKANGTNGRNSAIPRRNLSVEKLARAIMSLSDNPHPIKLDSSLEKPMLDALSPNFSKCFDLIKSKKELFSPTLSLFSNQNTPINAFLRTTTAYTIVQGGNKSNVIPDSSTVVLNHHIYPTDTVDGVVEYDRRIVNDDSIYFEMLNQSEPSPISPHDDTAFGYQVIKKSIMDSVKDVTVAPGLHIGTTDSKWYLNLTDQVYRISPYTATLQDIMRIHRGKEKISVQNYQQIIDFYYHLIQNANKTR